MHVGFCPEEFQFLVPSTGEKNNVFHETMLVKPHSYIYFLSYSFCVRVVLFSLREGRGGGGRV